MTKTLNQIFFSSTKIRIFFSAILGIRIFFLEKNHTPPPWKLNGPSLNGIAKIGTDDNLVDYTVQIAFVIFLFF